MKIKHFESIGMTAVRFIIYAQAAGAILCIQHRRSTRTDAAIIRRCPARGRRNIVFEINLIVYQENYFHN